MLGTPPRGKPNPGKVRPGAPASDSRSQDRDFSLQPDSRLHFPVQRAKVTSWGPTAHRGGGIRWSLPTHHLQLKTPQEAPGAGKFGGPASPAPLRVCGRLFQERTAWWRRGGVRIPLLTPLRWPLLQFPPASPPAPSRHPFSLLGC